jgi:E3 ubiquitin-protein ligase MARCH6
MYPFLQLYQDGIRRMNLTFVLWQLAIPAIVTLGLALALPYIVAHSIVPFFGMLHIWEHLYLFD